MAGGVSKRTFCDPGTVLKNAQKEKKGVSIVHSKSFGGDGGDIQFVSQKQIFGNSAPMQRFGRGVWLNLGNVRFPCFECDMNNRMGDLLDLLPEYEPSFLSPKHLLPTT